MSDFVNFAAAHGLVIERLEGGNDWHRVRTTDKKKKKNGSYKFLGDIGWVQNHATMTEIAEWRPDHEFTPAERREYAQRMAAKRDAGRLAEEQRRAAARVAAVAIIAECASGPHPYLARKGFPDAQGLVHPNGDLIIPMRDVSDYATVNSVQRISPEGGKLFLPGGKAKGSVFIIGRGQWRERWLVEGMATGLSVHAALSDLRRQAEVIVCFSAGNLKHVASLVRRPAFVMADHDASGTGQEGAEATGLPWVMPPHVGTDANDLHASEGLRRLVKLIQEGA